MFPHHSPAMRIANRIAVLGVLLIGFVFSDSSLFAAQCGGLPKNWHRIETAARDLSTTAETSDPKPLGLPSLPNRPCHCTGLGCSPIVPPTLPDHRVISGSAHDAILGFGVRLRTVSDSMEFPDAVIASYRYEVVLGKWRPPCSL